VDGDAVMTINRRRQPRFVLAIAWMIAFFLMAPAFVVVPVSLTDKTYLALPENGLSVAHWKALIMDPRWASAFWTSLIIGSASTALAMIAGTLSAIACWRLSSWIGHAVRAFVLMPLIIPTIVYALSLFRFYSDLRLLDSYAGVTLAHAAIGTPYVFIAASASLANFDRRLEQAARSLGASLSQAIRWVIIPGIMPGVLSGGIFAFVNSWDELVIVLFVASRKVVTLPRVMWNGIQEDLDPSIAAVATALILVTILLLAPVLLVQTRKAADA
jgi:putative spermidine/putrescine transport system permease protein